MKNIARNLIIVSIILHFYGQCALSQTSQNGSGVSPGAIKKSYYKDWKFQKLEINNTDEVHYGFLNRIVDDEPAKTLLIIIGGSGHRSVFGLKKDDKWIKPGNPLGFAKYIFSDYDILVSDKINMTPGHDHQNNIDVIRKYTVEGRIEGAALVIDNYLEHRQYENVYLFGISEGGFIIPKLYNSLKVKDSISKVIIWGAGGLSQYEEFVILSKSNLQMDPRKKADYASVTNAISDINANPTAIDKKFLGYSYVHWASFFNHSPINDLVKMDIPILIMHGAKDVSSPVETARYVQERFNELKKTNLTYYEYKDMGHGPQTEEEDKLFFGDLMSWLND